MQRIETLDGLRAVSIMIVIAAHAFHDNEKLADLGHMGVLLFFALSGYLITTRLLEERARSGAISLREFYLRRAFRIIPPALVYLGVVALLAALGVIVYRPGAFAGALLFYINYIDPGVNGWRVTHFWSLSVEEHFYALWPLALISFGMAKGWRIALGLIVIIVVWRATDHHFHLLELIFNNQNLHWNVSGTDALYGCAVVQPVHLAATILRRSGD